MRNHAPQNSMTATLERHGAKDSRTPRDSSLGKSVEAAQRQVEQRDYQARKRVLDFDDVMNLQREIIYGYRNEVLTTEDTRRLVHDIIEEVIPARVRECLAECDPYESVSTQLLNWASASLPVSVTPGDFVNSSEKAVSAMLAENVRDAYDARVGEVPAEVLDREERHMVLVAIDRQWQEHLGNMDELREGVNLRSQGQKDPLVEYKNEAYNLFVNLMDTIKQESLQNLFRSAASLGAFVQ